MKNLFYILVFFVSVSSQAQVSTTTFNTFLLAYKKDTTARGIVQRDLQKQLASVLVLNKTNAQRILDSTNYKALLVLKADNSTVTSLAGTVKVNGETLTNLKADAVTRLNSLEGWRTTSIDQLKKLEARPFLTQLDIDDIKAKVAKIPTAAISTSTSTTTTTTTTTLQ